jgi:hypothetical protein
MMMTCVMVLGLAGGAADIENLPRSFAHELPGPGTHAAEELDLWRVGVRFQAWTAGGLPANDMMGFSLYGSYNLQNLINDDWWFTLQVQHFSGFDFERPDDALFDISSPGVVDAVMQGTFIQFTLEWHPLRKESIIDIYVGAGFGVAILGDGTARDLPSSDITLKGSTGVEIHAVIGAALKVYGPIYLTVEFSATYVFTGWDATDAVSGRRESLDRWDAMGAGAGLEVRF